MRILIHTDANIGLSSDMAQSIQSGIEGKLGRFSGRINRVDVHLSDINSTKFEVNDKDCVMQVQASGRSPITVSDRAPSSVLAVSGAAETLARLLDATFERETHHKVAPSVRTMRAEEGLR